jgi:hypothetical protein
MTTKNNTDIGNYIQDAYRTGNISLSPDDLDDTISYFHDLFPHVPVSTITDQINDYIVWINEFKDE